MSKHTPGPWHINTAGSAKKGESFKVTEIYVYAPHVQDDTAICADIIDPVTQEPSEENARLIAAAPDLLEALQQVDRILLEANPNLSPEYLFGQIQKAWSICRPAIAKATGEST